MINLAICGICGKMGKSVFNLAESDKDFNVIFGVDKADGIFGGVPVFDRFEKAEKHIDKCGSEIVKNKLTVDAVIDFSSPSALEDLLIFAEKHSSAVVLATTGYSDNDFEIIKFYSEKIPIFYSQNLSSGLYSLINACKKICDNFFDFDVEIIEKHHNEKKDAPSGTAIKIANEISPLLSLKNKTDDANNLNAGCLGEKINGIPVHSVRGGGIFGEHEVLFMSIDEIISVKHTALNRNLFARSALNIAKFIAHMPSGLYGMDDYAEYLRRKKFQAL